MVGSPGEEHIALLERLAALNPLVIGHLELRAGQEIARVRCERSVAVGAGPTLLHTFEEVVTVAPGLGDAGRDSSRWDRELARAAARASRCRRWLLPAAGRVLELGGAVRILGVLNVTPDSFSDGGQDASAEDAVARGLAMIAAGADWIDIGGESTRPGAAPVPVDVELARVLPVIEGMHRLSGAVLSVDTSKAEVAAAAVRAGAAIVNDVTALRGDPRMAGVIAESGAAVVLMHMLGTPATMQQAPAYDDVVARVAGFLREALVRAARAGIDPASTLVDPGLGFGKTVAHNLTLLERLEELTSLGRPILVGASRKSFLGKLLDLPVDGRAGASVLAHTLAALRGAAVVRVHDVAETRLAMRLVAAAAAAGTREPPPGEPRQ